MEEGAVDFVGKDGDVSRFGERYDVLEDGMGDDGPGRVVGVVEDDELRGSANAVGSDLVLETDLCVALHQGFELADVRHVAV